MKRSIIALLLALTVALGLHAQQKVVIAAAANISAVAPRLEAAFAASHRDLRLEFLFGSSGTLVAQLLNGSPAQVFLSADTSFAQKLVDAGVAVPPVKVYARGSLILFSTNHLDFSKGLAILADPRVARIAVANPESAPYGRAAREALSAMGLLGSLESKFITGQNITQTLQFALSGADAGFINKSALYTKELRPFDREGEYWIAVDPSLYGPIDQGFVVMKAAASDPGVRAFVDFLESASAREIFAEAGYLVP
ncbi:MAG: molybdate ABC transporter substrate-binding protein [Treponema sp.]|nr:molybdate ABC transporter substrate-binding protein [Treponema sp.]